MNHPQTHTLTWMDLNTAKWKKSNTKGNRLYDCIKCCEKRQTYGKKHKAWELSLDYDSVCKSVCICQNSSTVHLPGANFTVS